MLRKTTITDAEHRALLAFAQQHGRSWKSRLCRLWKEGTGTEGAVLRGLGSRHGSNWLKRYRFPAFLPMPDTKPQHPLPVGQVVQILIPNMDDNDGIERRAPAGEFGRITHAHKYRQGWTYGVVQTPSRVEGFWDEAEFAKGEIILAAAGPK